MSVQPGGEIHDVHPFADPEQARGPVRRLRGRIPAAVTLWTAPGPAGLTVASTLVADGEPGRVYGLLDPDSDLYEALTDDGAFTVQLLTPGQQRVADRFGGIDPAPGGLFRQDDWRDTEWGPVLAGVTTWAGCRLDTTRDAGWSRLVEGTIAHVTLGDDPPLLHHRGHYRRLELPE
ncbi:MAG: flavin reductase family protein [Micromonosporaceae bacterium]